MRLLYCEIFVLLLGVIWQNTAGVINDRNDIFKTAKRRDIPDNADFSSTNSDNTLKENIEARISNFEATTPVFPLTAPSENYASALIPPKKETSFSEKDSPGYSYELPSQHSVYEHAPFPGPTFNHPKPVVYPPKHHYGTPPRPVYGPPPKPSYILYPKPSYAPQKPSFGLPPPRPQYGPPPKPISPGGDEYGSYKPEFIPAIKPVYGPPPRPIYGPPKSEFGHPPKQFHGFLTKPHYEPHTRPNFGPPFVPDFASKLPSKYPPPSFLSQHFGTSTAGGQFHGPAHPHHNIHSPPTPPEVSYDGWRPIKGPELKDLSFNHLNTIDEHLTPTQPEQSNGLFGGDLLPPLLSHTAFTDYPGTAQSLLYFPSNTLGVPSTTHHHGPECDLPTGNQLSPNGCCGPSPTNLAHPPYENQGLEYGVPYGVPSGKQIEGPNLRPKSPVKFRPPVPQGLLEPSGLHGSSQHSNFPGQSYIPPAVPEISKSNDNDETPSVDYSSKDTDGFEVPSKPSSLLEAPYHPKTVDYHVPKPILAKEPSQHFLPPTAAAVSLTGPNFLHNTFPGPTPLASPHEQSSYFGSGYQFSPEFQSNFQSTIPAGGNLLDFSNQGSQYNQWPNGEQQFGQDQIVPGDLLQNVLTAIEQPNSGFGSSSHGGEYNGEHLITAGSDHVQYDGQLGQIDKEANLQQETIDGQPLQRLAKEIKDKNKGIDKTSNFTNGHSSSIGQNTSSMVEPKVEHILQ